MKIVDINTKQLIEENDWDIPTIWWTTPEAWAQYKIDMAELKKKFEELERPWLYEQLPILLANMYGINHEPNEEKLLNEQG